MIKVINLDLEDVLIVRVNNLEVLSFSPKGKVQDKVPEMIHDLNLSLRLCNVLFEDEIHTVAQLLELTESEFLKIPGVGKKSLKELKSALSKYNYARTDSITQS